MRKNLLSRAHKVDERFIIADNEKSPHYVVECNLHFRNSIRWYFLNSSRQNKILNCCKTFKNKCGIFKLTLEAELVVQHMVRFNRSHSRRDAHLQLRAFIPFANYRKYLPA